MFGFFRRHGNPRSTNLCAPHPPTPPPLNAAEPTSRGLSGRGPVRIGVLAATLKHEGDAEIAPAMTLARSLGARR